MIMHALFTETSTERSLVAMARGDEIVYINEFPVGLSNSKYLAPAIDEGLKRLNIAPSQLSYVAVGVGPGSYTGIRVGAIIAKTFAFGAGVPLLGLCTLECFIPEKPGKFAVLIDAKIGGFYAITGTYENEKCTFTSPAQLVPIEQTEALLKNIPQIVSPKVQSLQTKLGHFFPNVSWHECAPNPMQMLRLSDAKFAQGPISKEGELELIYLRKTQAEIERQQN